MTRELEGLRMENENYYCWDPIVEKYLCLIMKPILLPLEDNIQKTKSIEVYEKESTMLSKTHMFQGLCFVYNESNEQSNYFIPFDFDHFPCTTNQL